MMQADLFPTEVRLRRVDPAVNMNRFYAMSIQPTLFGEWAVVRNWGRAGTEGRIRVDVVNGPGEAIDKIGRISRSKLTRGYVRF